jgi:hypothetical protein
MTESSVEPKNSHMWKEARQEVRQHWFITEYIAAYVQGLYTVYKCAGVQGAVANWSDH